MAMLKVLEGNTISLDFCISKLRSQKKRNRPSSSPNEEKLLRTNQLWKKCSRKFSRTKGTKVRESLKSVSENRVPAKVTIQGTSVQSEFFFIVLTDF